MGRGGALALYFFLQAEDGIRDRTVTGVQTCALPIYPRVRVQLASAGITGVRFIQTDFFDPERYPPPRSEERRVGKGASCRRTADEHRQHAGPAGSGVLLHRRGLPASRPEAARAWVLG